LAVLGTGPDWRCRWRNRRQLPSPPGAGGIGHHRPQRRAVCRQRSGNGRDSCRGRFDPAVSLSLRLARVQVPPRGSRWRHTRFPLTS